MAETTAPYKQTADRVVLHFGTHLALAKALGYEDLRNVSAWANGLRVFPEKHCVTIERETAGAIDRRELRPDDWPAIWPELATPEVPAVDRRAHRDQRVHDKPPRRKTDIAILAAAKQKA